MSTVLVRVLDRARAVSRKATYRSFDASSLTVEAKVTVYLEDGEVNQDLILDRA